MAGNPNLKSLSPEERHALFAVRAAKLEALCAELQQCLKENRMSGFEEARKTCSEGEPSPAYISRRDAIVAEIRNTVEFLQSL